MFWLPKESVTVLAAEIMPSKQPFKSLIFGIEKQLSNLKMKDFFY